MTHPIIILGAGLAGWSTVREFRKRDASTPLLLITADRGDFYAKPALSNAFAQQRGPAQLISTPAQQMVQTQQITLLAHTRVSAIHPVARTVSTTQGEFGYSQLVLATGAQPIRVPVAGDAADQVQSINSLDDFSAFYQRLTGLEDRPQSGLQTTPHRPDGSAKHVLIMGAGLIGCEFANDLAASGYRVTVVDPSHGAIAALLPPAASEQLRAALAALGVVWHFGTTVKSVMHAGVGRVQNTQVPVATALQVALSNGQVVDVDLVLSAIGLRADTTLAQAAGLACERGVVVDARLQTSDPNIFALGDSAQYAAGYWGQGGRASVGGAAAVTGGCTLPFVMPILSAAKALAATLAGTATEVVFPLMPIAIKTPALPIVVAAPAPDTPGAWCSVEPGIWQFADLQGQSRGFVLTGKQTSQRAAQAKLLLG